MKNKIKFITLLAFIGVLSAITGCVNQKFDKPQYNCDETSKANFTIKQLKDLYHLVESFTDTLLIDTDLVISGYVTSSDQWGNFYKQMVIEDSTAGIAVELDRSYLYNYYPVGSKIYVHLKGLYLGKNGGIVNIGSTYYTQDVLAFGRIQGAAVIDQHISNSCAKEALKPLKLTISQILADVNGNYINRYVEIDSVQFQRAELGETWADAINLASVSHNIIDKNDKTLVVYTSGYSTFANDTLPDGNGSIKGILSKYNGSLQFLVNSSTDAQFKGARFAEPYYKDFEDDDIFSGGWTNYVVQGVSWSFSTLGGGKYAMCKNYVNNANIPTESWYISPKLDLTNWGSPYLSFRNAYKYTGTPLAVKYSTNYDGVSNPNNSNFTWTTINYTASSGNFAWTPSGNQTIPKDAKYVAFIYKGSSTDGSTWEIDDIKIADASK